MLEKLILRRLVTLVSMMTIKIMPRMVFSAPLTVALLALAGCHGAVVNATIENHTGGSLQMIELDYPSASFGVNSLANGAKYPYSFEVHGSGQLRISYQDAKGTPHEAKGPSLHDGDTGPLDVSIAPDNTVHWQR
jgi:hypothetical protein